MPPRWIFATVLMLLWFWRHQSRLVFAGVALSQGGGCKSMEQGRVVYRYALLVVCGIQETQTFPFAVVMVALYDGRR